MRQKFTFEIDAKKNILTISESAESDPGTFLPLHFEQYDIEELKMALQKGHNALMELVRRKNFFPPNVLAVKLFNALSNFLTDGVEEKLVVDYDDTETLEPLEGLEAEEEEEEDVDLDGLLTSDDEDLSEDDIKEIDSDDDTPRFQIDDDSEQEN